MAPASPFGVWLPQGPKGPWGAKRRRPPPAKEGRKRLRSMLRAGCPPRITVRPAA